MRPTSPQVHRTAIDGLLLVDLALHEDTRGWFKESFRLDELTELGLPPFGVVQNNVSFNAEVGITRGIHAEPWDKYVSLAQGRAFAAIVDLRAGDSFGRVATMELHAGNALFVPRGCGNSYQTLTPNVIYTYLVNGHWSADAEYVNVQAFDPDLEISWPISEECAIRSERDRIHPPLSAVSRPVM